MDDSCSTSLTIWIASDAPCAAAVASDAALRRRWDCFSMGCMSGMWLTRQTSPLKLRDCSWVQVRMGSLESSSSSSSSNSSSDAAEMCLEGCQAQGKTVWQQHVSQSSRDKDMDSSAVVQKGLHLIAFWQARNLYVQASR